MVYLQYSVLLHASAAVALRGDRGRPRSGWQRLKSCLPCFGGQTASERPLLHDHPPATDSPDPSWLRQNAEREREYAERQRQRNAENEQRQKIVADLNTKLDEIAVHPMVLHASDGMTLDEVSELYEWLDNADRDDDTRTAIRSVFGDDYIQMYESMKLGKKLLKAVAKVIDQFVMTWDLPFRRDDYYDDEHYQFILYHTQKQHSDNWEKFFGWYKHFLKSRGMEQDLQIQNPIVIDPRFSFFGDFEQMLVHIASGESYLMRSSITQKEVLAFQCAMEQTWKKYCLLEEGNFDKSYDQYNAARKIVDVIQQLTNPETFERFNPRYEEDRDDIQKLKNRFGKQIAENLETIRDTLPRRQPIGDSNQNPFFVAPPPDRYFEEQVANIQKEVEIAINLVSSDLDPADPSDFYQDTRLCLYNVMSNEDKYYFEFRKRDLEQNDGAVLEKCELAFNAIYHHVQVKAFNNLMDVYDEDDHPKKRRLQHAYGVLRDQHYEAFCRSSDDLRSRRGLPRNSATFFVSLEKYKAPPHDKLGLPGDHLDRAVELDQKLQELASHPNLIDSDILEFFEQYQKSSYLTVDSRFLNFKFEDITCIPLRADPDYDYIRSMLRELAEYKKELSGKSCGEPQGKQHYQEEIEKLQRRFAEHRAQMAELIPKTVHELLAVLVVHQDKYLVRRRLNSKQMYNLSFFFNFALRRHGQSLRKWNLHESCQRGVKLLELFKKSMFGKDSSDRNRAYEQLLAARTELRRYLPKKLLDYRAVCKSFRDVFKRKQEGQSLVVGAKVIPYDIVNKICNEVEFPGHFDN